MCCLHKLAVVFCRWLQKKHCHAPLDSPTGSSGYRSDKSLKRRLFYETILFPGDTLQTKNSRRHVKKRCVISLRSNDVRHKSADRLSKIGSKPLIHWGFCEFGWSSSLRCSLQGCRGTIFAVSSINSCPKRIAVFIFFRTISTKGYSKVKKIIAGVYYPSISTINYGVHHVRNRGLHR
jgi:hypothetical protein